MDVLSERPLFSLAISHVNTTMHNLNIQVQETFQWDSFITSIYIQMEGQGCSQSESLTSRNSNLNIKNQRIENCMWKIGKFKMYEKMIQISTWEG